MNSFLLIRLLGLTIAIGTLFSCSNSEYIDEFSLPISNHAYEEAPQDTAYIDSFTEFPSSGFYTKPFTITLPDNKPLNCETDGAPPTKESPSYKELRIETTTTIRCTDYSANTTTETIRTYIFEKKPTIPTILITTDPNSLFNPDTGIYMEGPNAEEKNPHYGANYWLDKEIPIFVELIETNATTPAFAKFAGLKIFGNFSRAHPKKSVAIHFRKKYGDNRLIYPLFPEFPNLTRFKSFILRNNGSNPDKDYIRDRLASSISEGLGVDYQRGRFVLVYYNGVYFGIHDMREKATEYYFETHYGIDPNNINLLKADNSVSAGSPKNYTSLMQWIEKNNLENDSNYTYLATQIDIENYINYMQIELFSNNRDWPGNNQKKWSQVTPQTPWKWFLYDMDYGFDGGNAKTIPTDNVFEFATTENGDTWTNRPIYTFLFRNLLKNKEFKAAFINRMATLLHMNFESSHILSQIENMMKEIKTEIPRDQKRWSRDTKKMNENLNQIKSFAQNRQKIIQQQLKDYFKLNDYAPITFSVSGEGSIFVHNLPLSNHPITINFFKDFPVSITAIPKSGHKWSNWSDGVKSEKRILYPGKDKEIKAIFK